MKNFIKDFVKCGILGWCLEIVFTSIQSLRRRDPNLSGTTSLWMFPIYGAGCLLKPVAFFIKRFPWYVRGGIYTAFIFCAEFIAGKLLCLKNMCPWDYGKARWHIARVIRLDYAPCWFATGLLMEKVIRRRSS